MFNRRATHSVCLTDMIVNEFSGCRRMLWLYQQENHRRRMGLGLVAGDRCPTDVVRGTRLTHFHMLLHLITIRRVRF